MYCNRNNQLKQRKERQIKNEQSSNTNKLILIILITTKLSCFSNNLVENPQQMRLVHHGRKFSEHFMYMSLAMHLILGEHVPAGFHTRSAFIYLFFFCFPAQKFCLCLFNQVTTKMLSNEQIISTQNTYTSFTNVASGCAKRLPSDRPTELNKTQTTRFLIEGRKESHKCFVPFHCTLCATCLTDQGKNQAQS